MKEDTRTTTVDGAAAHARGMDPGDDDRPTWADVDREDDEDGEEDDDDVE